jgi:hypothetical protein
MQRVSFARCALAALIAVTVASAIAQQDQGPILRPKPRPAATTLLVLCDLACDWKLDGEAKGRIEAGGSAKAKVELGEHLVIVATTDGQDTVQQLAVVKVAGQKIVNLPLKPVRDARLNADARVGAAKEEVSGVWTDPATGLMWTKKDNESDVSWQQTVEYCRSSQLAGYLGWRLPTIDELRGIYDPKVADKSGRHVKGNLQLSGWQWSSSSEYNSVRAWGFGFDRGSRDSFPFVNSSFSRALCVRHSGE